jgi:hypothetical protein
MTFHNFLLISVAAGLTAGIAMPAFAADGPGPADPVSTTTQTTSITRNFVFSPVTLASSETARVVVVNTAAPATGNNTAPSCVGKITFLASGSTPPTNGIVTFTLGAGQFTVADLPYGKSGISTSPGEVVGKVESDITLGSKAPCSLEMSLIVFDSTTGAAHVILGSASAQGGIGPIPFASGIH